MAVTTGSVAAPSHGKASFVQFSVAGPDPPSLTGSRALLMQLRLRMHSSGARRKIGRRAGSSVPPCLSTTWQLDTEATAYPERKPGAMNLRAGAEQLSGVP